MRPAGVALSLTVVVAAAGCGSGGSAHTTSSTSAASSTTTGTSASAQPSPTSAATSKASAPAVRLTGRIVFRRYADADGTSGSLFVINADGTGERRLTAAKPEVIDNEANWAPDGKKVIFTRSTGGPDGLNEAHKLVTIVDGHETSLTPGKPTPGQVVFGWDGGADYSPDGRRIAYVHAWGVRGDTVQHSEIYIADANGKHPRRITRFPDVSGISNGPRWSPDGKALVFDRALSVTEEPPGGQALFVVNTDGTKLHRLTSWSVMAGGDPDWSRAANLIAFRAAPEESGIGNFFTIRPDGSGLTQVTHFTNTVISHQVGFSPDGRWLTFSTATPDGANRLQVAAVDGSSVLNLTHPKFAESGPDWAS